MFEVHVLVSRLYVWIFINLLYMYLCLINVWLFDMCSRPILLSKLDKFHLYPYSFLILDLIVDGYETYKSNKSCAL